MIESLIFINDSSAGEKDDHNNNTLSTDFQFQASHKHTHAIAITKQVFETH